MKKTILNVLVIGALAAGCIGSYGSISAAGNGAKFKDVPSTHWAASAILAAVEAGYFKGYADGSFKPGAPVTKAEMASILGRLNSQPVDSTETYNFSDIPDWAEEGVKAAVQKGFIDPGDYSGKLNANAALSRGELAVWLTNGLAKVNADYGTALKDVTNTVVPAKEYFTGKLPANRKNAVALALGTGLMSVGDDKQFGIERTTTRAEVAVLIARYEAVSKKQPSEFQGLRELREVGLTGTNLKVIAPSYQVISREIFTYYDDAYYDNAKITDDFSMVRNKELVTVTNYADVKVKNWIIISPYATKEKRSIYYPVFLDEGENNLLRGDYYSFAEFDMEIKGNMTRLQAGSLLGSSTIDPLLSPKSHSSGMYSLPKIDDYNVAFNKPFNKNRPNYWGSGLLHFNEKLNPEVKLTSKEGFNFWVRPEN